VALLQTDLTRLERPSRPKVDYNDPTLRSTYKETFIHVLVKLDTADYLIVLEFCIN